MPDTRAPTLLTLALVVGLTTVVALADGVGDGAAGEATPVWRLVEELGSSRYARRAAATRALVERGRAVLPALRRAARHDIPEVAARARALVRVLTRGAIARGHELSARALWFLQRRRLKEAASWMGRAHKAVEGVPLSDDLTSQLVLVDRQLALRLLEAGDALLARQRADAALALQRRVARPDPRHLLLVLVACEAQVACGALDAAEPLLRDAIGAAGALRAAPLDPDATRTSRLTLAVQHGYLQLALAEVLRQRARYREAIARIDGALDAWAGNARLSLGAEPLARAARWRVRGLAGEEAAAATGLAAEVAALDKLHTGGDVDAFELARALTWLGEARLRAGQLKQALPPVERARRLLLQRLEDGARHPDVLEPVVLAGRIHLARGERAKALTYQRWAQAIERRLDRVTPLTIEARVLARRLGQRAPGYAELSRALAAVVGKDHPRVAELRARGAVARRQLRVAGLFIPASTTARSRLHRTARARGGAVSSTTSAANTRWVSTR